jgi:hypothetical protein
MKAYSSTPSEDLRSKALDVIDDLLASQVREMEQLVESYDAG